MKDADEIHSVFLNRSYVRDMKIHQNTHQIISALFAILTP